MRPWTRLTWLYLRSRLTGLAVAALAVPVAGAALWLWSIDDGEISVMPILSPLAAAAIVAAGARSPFGDAERTASRPLAPLRLGHLMGLLLLAAVGLAVVAARWGATDSEWSYLRNLAGFTGLALLAARVLGGGIAWVIPFGYGGWALYRFGQTTPWDWAVQTATDRGAAMIALVLLLAGLAAVVPSGARDVPGETH